MDAWGWKGIQSAEDTRQRLGEPLADLGRGAKSYCGVLTGCQVQPGKLSNLHESQNRAVVEQGFKPKSSGSGVYS